MKIRILGSTMLAVLGWQTASAVEVSWYRQPGSGVSIASNASASLWMIGTDSKVYKWDVNSKQFVRNGNDLSDGVSLSTTQIAVSTTDQLWVVDETGFRTPWISVNPAKAREVAIGVENNAWIIGTDARAGGYGVYQGAALNQFTYNFTYANFGAVRIAVDKSGNAWVVTDRGEIHRYNVASKAWEPMPANTTGARARSIHAGAASGAVWMIGTQPIPGGYPIYQWNASTRRWEPYGTYGAVDITEAAGVPWIVQSDGRFYSKAEPTTPSAPVNVTQTWPQPTPQPEPEIRITEKGKLLCSSTGSLDDCDENTKADFVGKYTLDTTCDEGFFDMIHGGTCWKCDPGYDGKGAFIRSTTPVDSDTACWRVPKESTGRATKVKSPAWAWDCPSGSFWDGYSPDGAGGSCWKCPADLPRRTAAPVWESNACASSLNETRKAIFLSYNGCPKPDPEAMDLSGKRTPGKPFLDIAGSACFACPITDATGNFLISDRNANFLYTASNTGCTIKLKWKPPTFYEPGLAYMHGVKDLIWERKLFDGARITGYLYDAAEVKGLGDATPAAKEWVKQQWQEILRNPYNNDQFRAYVFILLKEALKKEEVNRTAAEKRLIRSFEIYIQQRRTYLAEQALAMYDAWKASDEKFRANTGQSKSWSALFYYGTVPLDFQGTLSGLMGLGASGGAVLGSLVSTHQFTKGITVIDEVDDAGVAVKSIWRTQLNGITSSLKLLKTVQGLTAVSGAAIIQVAAAILSSIAIDQFVAIESARPNLEAALTEAKKRVDLDVLATLDNGEDMLYLNWARAMDTTDPEDAQVLQLAAMAQLRAEQSGYTAPPKEYHLVADIPADTLSSGTSSGFLQQGNKLVSRNGTYKAEIQADGNFVIYSGTTAIWATGTNGKGTAPYRLAMQADSNLVVYGSSSAIWASGVRAGTAPYKLIMQDDGNLVVYDNSMRVIWASGTKR